VSAQELESQIDRYLARIEISTQFKDWAVKYLRELNEQESSSRNDVIQSQQKAYQDCIHRIDNLVRLKTATQNANGSLLSDEEYKRQRTALLQEKASLEELLKDAGHRVERWLQLSENVFAFACRARERFAKGNPMTKRAILVTIRCRSRNGDRVCSRGVTHPTARECSWLGGRDGGGEEIPLSHLDNRRLFP